MTKIFPKSSEVQSIANSGKLIKHQAEWIGKFGKENLQAILDAYYQTEKVTIRKKIDGGQEIPEEKGFSLGQGHEYITGKVQFSREELEKKIKAISSNQYLELKLIDVEIIQLFPDVFLRESKRLAQFLAEKFYVQAVYLFGSLIREEIITPATDIDLAVSGLQPEFLYKAIGNLERETQFPFDLVDLDEAPLSLRERILKEGKLLYERELVAVGG